MKSAVKFSFLLLIIFLKISIYAQDSNVVNYSLWLEKPVSFGTLDTKVDEGSFKEGKGFVIPKTTLPSSPIDFSMYQKLYDALTGGVFTVEYGALNNDIIMKIFIRKLVPNGNTYLNLGVDKDTLFSYFEIRIWELPDSNLYPEKTSYYFNEGYHAYFSVPKSPEFLEFLNMTNISQDDSLAFAYLEEQNINLKNVDDWTPEGIQTIETADSIKFKAIHLSRIGGGKKKAIAKVNPTSGIELNELNEIPNNFELFQNYPNPFNPSTKIKFSIPQLYNKNSAKVSIKIFDVLGRQILTLVNENKRSGVYEINFDTNQLIRMTSGIYFYSLQADNYRVVRKMILTK
ncbi:MAG: T9SS type A sorting domain-containing protein [Ignavibacteriae bacterium]|nr:T9SS type A sorting domain-containing protein [Ignavibacteriota bacterium]